LLPTALVTSGDGWAVDGAVGFGPKYMRAKAAIRRETPMIVFFLSIRKGDV
jgi:hypothetical protein